MPKKDNNKTAIKKKYVINFEKFFDLVTHKSANEKNNDSTVTEIWQPDQNNDLRIVNKEIVDNKYDSNNNLCGVRYDFLNGLINQVLSVYSGINNTLFISESQMSFGQKIIFESFKKEGVIYEIKDNNGNEDGE